MPKPTLEEKIRNFNTEYNVKFDPHVIEESARINSVFENYTFNKKDEKVSRATTYWKALTETLADSLNAKTRINKNGDYDLSDFDIVSFVLKFEEIMQQSNEQSANPRKRKPFENMVFEKIIERAKDSTAAYDKPLFSIWTKKVIDDEISYKDLKEVTDESVRSIENSERYQHGNVSREDLVNVVYAHEAMFRVCQSRGFWWKVFHLYQNHQEHKYLESLSVRITQYIEKNYPIEEISDGMVDSIMKQAYTNTEYSIRRERDKKIEEEIQKKQKEAEAKNREISAVEEKMKPLAENPDTKDKLVDEMLKNLPDCSWNKNTQKTMFQVSIIGTLIHEAQEANKRFDNGMVYGGNPQKLMLSGVKQVFQRAYLLSSSLGYMQVNDQLVAAQVITDVIMKNLSPVALEGEKYAEFANGYVLNNPSKFADITGMDGTEYMFKEAQKAYSDRNCEKVFLPELNPVANENVVAPVHKAPSINGLSINKN